MKIVQLDNIASTAFNYTKFLRKAGLDCDLLVEKGSGSDPAVSMPERHSWVKYWTRVDPISKFFVLKKLTEGYDLIHANGGVSAYAQFFRKPFVVHSMGSDLRLVASSNTWSDLIKGKLAWQEYWSFSENLRYLLMGFLLRRAIRKCDKFFFFQPDQVDLIEKMGIKNAVFVFQIIDTDGYKPKKVKLSDKQLRLFYPTRHSWTTKGNDKFFRAFAKFLKHHPNTILISTYWDIHKEKSKALVEELGIEKNVKFIDFLDKEGMKEGFYTSHAIIDEFNIGSFGPTALEAMSCEKPVLRYIDVKLNEKFYGKNQKPPIVNVRSEEEIFEGLMKITDRKYREKLGKEARKFVVKHHHWKKVTGSLIREYKDILQKRIVK